MFNNNELAIIWFALLAEQRHHDAGSASWFKYERMLRRIETKVGASPRPHLKVVNNEKEKTEDLLNYDKNKK